METLDLVRSWKRPELRTETALGHPAGEITLWTAAGLARRADLLSAPTGPADNTFETPSTALIDDEAW